MAKKKTVKKAAPKKDAKKKKLEPIVEAAKTIGESIADAQLPCADCGEVHSPLMSDDEKETLKSFINTQVLPNLPEKKHFVLQQNTHRAEAFNKEIAAVMAFNPQIETKNGVARVLIGRSAAEGLTVEAPSVIEAMLRMFDKLNS